MRDDRDGDDRWALATNRAMEIVVALGLLAGCAIVIYDSTGIRLAWPQSGPNQWMPEVQVNWSRFTWQEGLGPGPSYFPFWVALILGVSSFVNLMRALAGHGAGETFVTLRPFLRVLAVLAPSLAFVALIGGVSLGPVVIPRLGIYVASAIFIFFFMIAVGRENALKAVCVGLVVPVALFFMFEKWFLVPLPKGPLETWLGY